MPKQKKEVASDPMWQAVALGLSREDIALIFLLPNVRSFGRLLAAKDANNTGRDDELARLLEATAVGIEAYVASKG